MCVCVCVCACIPIERIGLIQNWKIGKEKTLFAKYYEKENSTTVQSNFNCNTFNSKYFNKNKFFWQLGYGNSSVSVNIIAKQTRSQ